MILKLYEQLNSIPSIHVIITKSSPKTLLSRPILLDSYHLRAPWKTLPSLFSALSSSSSGMVREEQQLLWGQVEEVTQGLLSFCFRLTLVLKTQVLMLMSCWRLCCCRRWRGCLIAASPLWSERPRQGWKHSFTTRKVTIAMHWLVTTWFMRMMRTQNNKENQDTKCKI